jgi:3,4-dihydroxy 2-butanone 4-phosphate synthase
VRSSYFAFLLRYVIPFASGYICIALPGDRLEELQIPMMVPDNQERHKTAYTVTVDYTHGECSHNFLLLRRSIPPPPSTSLRDSSFYFTLGTTTGISAHDRSMTVRALAAATSISDDFTRPGHMVPLRARDGGVLTRKGHTEAAIDLCRLTGQPLAGVLCELVNDDPQGTMARRDDCRAFADRWGLKIISVDMLVEWRRSHAFPVERLA